MTWDIVCAECYLSKCVEEGRSKRMKEYCPIRKGKQYSFTPEEMLSITKRAREMEYTPLLFIWRVELIAKRKVEKKRYEQFISSSRFVV